MFTPLRIVSLLALLATASASASSMPTNEPWISHYGGGISWEHEKAQMDNFAIQILNDPNLIGYILIYSGANSCRGEAQARALRIKKYLMNVRGVPWDRVMWKDAGRYRDKGLDIFFLGFERGIARFPDFPYEPPPQGHAIRDCRVKRTRR
jgi:hypothetical protein